jgi:hypothetical protein
MPLVLAQDQTATVELVTNQLLLLATVVGAIAALPALIQFVVDMKKRRERIALSLEDEPTPHKAIALAGLDETIADIADLVDRAAYPEAYRDLALGNEILILGPALSGKKSLARRIAQLAKLSRIITVYNPRNTDALAKAKSLLKRSTRSSTTTKMTRRSRPSWTRSSRRSRSATTCSSSRPRPSSPRETTSTTSSA